ncbi:yceI-like domain protein [Mycobacteroides abscessus 1948]|uniref:YceI-like domain protein n=1 Tax=Mycobacteroides abscessus 1948 TaxID=1299323 RepID=A0A829QLH9_9MYCO|nr:yceI-like domain protein [Mycobacteroides abscessus 1948]
MCRAAPSRASRASAEINRSDFGITGGAGLVGEKVTLTFNIEAGHPEAPSN